MDDDHQLDALTSLFLLAREMRREIHDLMAGEDWGAEAGFRPPCMAVLDVVARRQPVSQREISDHLGLDASDVVGVLDILERAAMVERRRDPYDRRRHAVVLTERGKAAAQRFAELRDTAVDTVLAGLEAEERALLVELLSRAAHATRV